ncbi:WD repeat-containing protein on Y chromosome [Varanus komodoensis]|nr:WD repeat-containing protein on Y chromosome [Varanus komodoensis]
MFGSDSFIFSGSSNRNARLWSREARFEGTFGQEKRWNLKNPSIFTHSKNPRSHTRGERKKKRTSAKQSICEDGWRFSPGEPLRGPEQEAVEVTKHESGGEETKTSQAESKDQQPQGLPVLSRPGLECLYLVLGDRDRLGILLVYRAPFCPSDSLTELTEIVSDLVLKTPRMLVLGDFNLHAETGLTGAVQDFMASMTAMGLSQHVIGPTHERGHTLDLVFSTGQEEGDLRVRNLCLTPFSRSDHFLVRFELGASPSLCKGVDQLVMVHPWSWMDPDGSLKALGDFLDDKAGAPVDALVELWNGEMARAIDTIAPKCPLRPHRAHPSPWYTSELWMMKRVGRCLERRWRKSWDESDRTRLRAHYRAYAVAVRAAKKKFFSTSIASSQCRPAELF